MVAIDHKEEDEKDVEKDEKDVEKDEKDVEEDVEMDGKEGNEKKDVEKEASCLVHV